MTIGLSLSKAECWDGSFLVEMTPFPEIIKEVSDNLVVLEGACDNVLVVAGDLTGAELRVAGTVSDLDCLRTCSLRRADTVGTKSLPGFKTCWGRGMQLL